MEDMLALKENRGRNRGQVRLIEPLSASRRPLSHGPTGDAPAHSAALAADARSQPTAEAAVAHHHVLPSPPPSPPPADFPPDYAAVSSPAAGTFTASFDDDGSASGSHRGYGHGPGMGHLRKRMRDWDGKILLMFGS